jgi:peptidoglycan/LPS O-acetylase OafA/YrhL
MLDKTKPLETSREPTAPDEQRHRQNNFDLLRLVAAILVVVGHIEYPYFGHKADWFSIVSGQQSGGGLGVSIFFVISGYLVTQSRQRSASVASFALKRALRILPAVAIWILVLAVAIYPLTDMALSDYVFSKQMLGFLLNMLILPNNSCVAPIVTDFVYGCGLTGATWSLTYEVIMYAMVAALGFAGLAFQRGFLIAALVALLVAFMRDVLYPLGEFSINVQGINLFLFIPHRGLPFIALFIVGALLNFIPAQILRRPSVLAISAALYIGAFYTNPVNFVVVQTLVFPFIVLWFGLRRFRLASIVDRVGDLSYGVFLYHWPVMTLVWTVFHNRFSPLTMALLVAMITGAAAYLSYHLVEKPALAFKRRTPATPIRGPSIASGSSRPVPLSP